jgi:hypothetical protein
MYRWRCSEYSHRENSHGVEDGRKCANRAEDETQVKEVIKGLDSQEQPVLFKWAFPRKKSVRF